MNKILSLTDISEEKKFIIRSFIPNVYSFVLAYSVWGYLETTFLDDRKT